MYDYEMPEEIKQIITDDFLGEFRNQLFRIHRYYSLDTFAENGLRMNTGTIGWYAAFGKACLLTDKEELLDYWRSLAWYDSDLFDGELADILVERGFMLGALEDVIESQLGIPTDDLRICNDCGRWYSKDMVVELGEDDKDIILSPYRCLCCQDIKEMSDKNEGVTDYYKNVVSELDEYCKNNPVMENY